MQSRIRTSDIVFFVISGTSTVLAFTALISTIQLPLFDQAGLLSWALLVALTAMKELPMTLPESRDRTPSIVTLRSRDLSRRGGDHSKLGDLGDLDRDRSELQPRSRRKRPDLSLRDFPKCRFCSLGVLSRPLGRTGGSLKKCPSSRS